jgi:hypothetical protein
MKDPAVLFYTQDFLTGTMLMTPAQRGNYIVLLCLQHQKGRLTERDMLKICGEYDEDIWEKFARDSNGLFYNLRMETEGEKRRNYTNSRRKNLKKDSHMESHMNSHMENENEDVNVIVNKSTKGANKKFVPPTIAEVVAYFKEKGYKEETARKAFEYYDVADWTDSKGDKVRNWKQKMNSVWFKEENKAPALISIPKPPKDIR